MTNKKFLQKILSVLVCFVLITAIALTVTGCQKSNVNEAPQTSGNTVSDEAKETVSFKFVVVDGEGKEQSFDIETTEKTVGAALVKENLIEGEESSYGLYVKKVNGITADYDADGTYWAFYIDGQYASTSVDATEIIEGTTYMFKVEKG